MATTTRTLRLRDDLRGELDRIARRTRRSFSEVTQDLLDEAIRMRAVPGIWFAEEPAGREAKIAGTGLAVWEVAAVLDEIGGDRKTLRKRFDWLNEAQIVAALLYMDRYAEEIDVLVAENRAEALAARPVRGATEGSGRR